MGLISGCLCVRSVLLNIPGLLLVNILASLVGLTVYAYYADAGCDPLEEGYIANANQVGYANYSGHT